MLQCNRLYWTVHRSSRSHMRWMRRIYWPIVFLALIVVFQINVLASRWMLSFPENVRFHGTISHAFDISKYRTELRSCRRIFVAPDANLCGRPLANKFASHTRLITRWVSLLNLIHMLHNFSLESRNASLILYDMINWYIIYIRENLE